MNDNLSEPATVSAGLFIEADMKDRADGAYDSVFSPPSRSDRVRTFKYGLVFSGDVALTEALYLNASRLEMQGGYDARATEIYNVGFGYKY